jgi:hypothetical protein
VDADGTSIYYVHMGTDLTPRDVIAYGMNDWTISLKTQLTSW